MTIIRVTAEWSGFTGAPGYTNFHYLSSGDESDFVPAQSHVANFFTAIRGLLPGSVEITVSGEGEVLDEQTGTLVDYVYATDGDVVIDSPGISDYAGPAGAVVNWLTSTINRGRRVRGRTFLVPLNSTAYDNVGNLTSAALTTLRDAASTAASTDVAGGFAVWSRPVNGAGGVAAPVTGSNVPDLAAVLRSRRD